MRQMQGVHPVDAMTGNGPVEALAGAMLHTPDGLRPGLALLTAGGAIRDILPQEKIPPGMRTVTLAGGTLAAGFIDIQVNGGGGATFNETPDAETLRIMARAHRAFGTTGFLPTYISGPRAGMERAVAAVRAALAQDAPGVLGIHFEGPHINASRRGAHDAGSLRPLATDDIRLLTSLGTGRTLVTLAPECVAPEDIAALVRRGAIVAAGHTEADRATLARASAQGLTGVTHLFNAMGPFNHREPGAAGAALADDRLACGIIADGVHVHWDALRIAARVKPSGKLLLVTDAMAPVGATAPLRAFRLAGETVRIEDGCLRNREGRLAGSLLDMGRAVRNCVAHADIPLAEALAMAAAYPADYLGLAGSRGRLAPGLRADMVWLDAELRVRATWIGGTREDAAAPLNEDEAS